MREEPKDSAHLHKEYDVEEAIKVVRGLGDDLIAATAHAKHQFRREWVDQLISRYRESPGKPVLHLSDLPDLVIPVLSSDVASLLRPSWDRLASELGSEWESQRFRCLWDVVKKGEASRWSALLTWRRYCKLTGFVLDDLESFVIGLRAAGTGTSRVIKNPKLPFRLCTPDGAKIFGYRGDVTYDTSAFNNKDLTLHDDYR